MDFMNESIQSVFDLACDEKAKQTEKRFEFLVSDLMSKFQVNQESLDQLDLIIKFKNEELEKLEKLYELIKSSNVLNRKICAEIQQKTNSTDLEKQENVSQVSQLNISDSEQNTQSKNQTNQEHESIETSVSTVQIPHACKFFEHLEDPRLTIGNQAKQHQIDDLQVLKYDVKISESIRETNNSLLLNKEQTTTSLPISIMSILFKAENKTNQINKLPSPSVVKKTKEVVNQSEPIENKKEDMDWSTNSNPVFDRIQNLINTGFSNEPAIKKNKQSQYTIENKGIRIQRSKPYPSQVEFKSELILAYQQEKANQEESQISSRPVFTLINKVVRNETLEKRMSERCERKLNSIKQNFQRDSNSLIVNNLLDNRADLVSNLKHLMNYDFCKNKLKTKKKPNNKKKKKKNKQNDPLFADMFDQMEQHSAFEADTVLEFNNSKENNKNDDELDLYGDLAKQIDLEILPNDENVEDFLNEEKENNKQVFQNRQVTNQTNERYTRPRSRERKRSRSRCTPRSPSTKLKNRLDYHRRSSYSSSKRSSSTSRYNHRESDRSSSRSRRHNYY